MIQLISVPLNIAPIISSITVPQSVIAGTSAQFTAIATDVGVKDTLTYSWNFGDGSNASIGQNSAHTYAIAGTYNIVLTVTDNNGSSISQTQSLTVNAAVTTTSGGIRAGGTVSINGNVDLDGNTSSRIDDTPIYAGQGINLSGNITLPVKRDAQGQPMRDQNGKLILIDNALTIAPGANSSSNPNQYSNINIASQTITIPSYADIKQQDFSIPANTTINTFDIKKTPIQNSSDWSKFPPAGTSSQPTIVRIINGDLNLPANISLNNYIIIVENGNISFSQGNPIVSNVKLIANSGNINLNSVKATNLSLSASGNINLTGNTQLGGTSILNSNGNTTFNGSFAMSNSSATMKVIAQGDISVSGNTTIKGQLATKKNISINGKTTIIGGIDALQNVSIGGNISIVAQL
jgi:PKD repeat protein